MEEKMKLIEELKSYKQTAIELKDGTNSEDQKHFFDGQVRAYTQAIHAVAFHLGIKEY